MRKVKNQMLLVVVLGMVACVNSKQENKPVAAEEANCVLVIDTLCDPDTIKRLKYGEVKDFNNDSIEPPCYIKRLKMTDEMAWIGKLQKLPLPKGVKPNDVSVYFRYNKTIGGYTVTCRFFPFYHICETGKLIALFEKGNTSFTYYENEKADNYHTVCYGLNTGWMNNDVFEFGLVDKRSSESEWEWDDQSQLGYYMPYVVADINFDGQDEFLVNDFYRGQGGNNYAVYVITSQGIKPIDHDIWLYGQMNNNVRIDKKSYTIDVLTWSGAWSSLLLRFKKKESANQVKTSLPQLRYDLYQKDVLIEGYKDRKNFFELQYVEDKVGDTVFVSKREGVKWVTTGKRFNKR